MLGHVRNNQGDHHFKSDNHMLHGNCQKQDVCASPKASIALKKPPLHFRLLFGCKRVKILEVANLFGFRVPGEEKNGQVDWNGKKGNETNDGHPVADSA